MKDGISVTIQAWTFRDVLNTCGAVTEEKDKESILSWIKITAEHGHFIAYGMHSVSCARVEGDCYVDGTDDAVSFFVPTTFRFPARTEHAVITLYENGETILEFKGFGDVTGRELWKQPEGEYYDVASLFKKIEDGISQYGDGAGQYFIVVRPRELMKALHGLKNEEAVIMNFSDRFHGFIMRPYDSGMQAEVCMLPVRTMDDTKAHVGGWG